MSNKPVVTVIPATIDRFGLAPLDKPKKRRVAAYARVSTELEEQQSSYAAQVDFYTKHIQSNPEWEFVRVYADEGISATSTKKRSDFNQMIEDALAGKIDLILTKSISRFARNTVDTLTNVRKLKEKGIEVYFEKENIYTLDAKGELLITIMSSIAQEESRSISENTTWGQRKRMQDGKVTMCYGQFLGYRKGTDGKPEIDENEAVTIRQIYSMFLAGRTYREIAAHLTVQGVLTPRGNPTWHTSTVQSILQNEKYAGRALMQKSYTVDFLTKKTKINEGEIPQYYVENSHPAIIPPSTFELVQDEIRRRKGLGKQLSCSGLFVGKIFCGECGGIYGNKTWNSRYNYRKSVLQCNKRYKRKGAISCHTPHLTEDIVKSVFVRAWDMLMTDKSRLIAEYETAIEKMADTAAFDKETAVLMANCSEAKALTDECIAENARHPINQEEYQKRYDELVARYDFTKAELEKLAKDKQDRIAQKEKLCRFLRTLQETENPLTTFDERLWRETVESVTVYSADDVAVRFHSGTVIHVSTE